MQEHFAKEVFAKFSSCSVPFLPIKGFETRKLYPHPEARPSCDMDVLYRESDKDTIEEILKEEGFAFAVENVTHQEWKKEGITFEMHHSLMGQIPQFHEYYQDVWTKLVLVDGAQYAFKKEDGYIYHLVHAVKHLLHSGFGVRTVLDVHMYRKDGDMDETYLSNELEKLGLQKFAMQIEKLAKVWFWGDEEDEETMLFGDYVLSCGTFGSRKNLALKGKGNNAFGAKWKYMIKVIFPPYSSMKYWYPAVKKFPPVLPFVWVYRWFEVLFTRRRSIKKAAKAFSNINSDRLQKMKKIKEMTGVSRFGDV